jgi:predicted DNA-binding transcriptional regulator YafY
MHDTPKKFDRIVAILIQLQSRKVVKAHDLAQRFGVSLRTIYRDIRTLEASGVPLYGEAGTGYSLVDGYRLPPVMFTREEAASFIAAEKLMQKFTDKSLGESYNSAMFKIKAILKEMDKDWLQHMEENVLMQQTYPVAQPSVPNALGVLFTAVAEKKCVTLHYKAFEASEASERTIEPVGIFHDHSAWYAMAYCHLRNDYRQFRTDRIQFIEATQQPFTKQHQPLEHYIQREKQQYPTTLVRILVQSAKARYLYSERHYHGFVGETVTPDGVEMVFESQNITEWFPRWYLMYADYATILEPEELKGNVLKLMERYQNQLQDKTVV